jgi:hypothetical protein
MDHTARRHIAALPPEVVELNVKAVLFLLVFQTNNTPSPLFSD